MLPGGHHPKLAALVPIAFVLAYEGALAATGPFIHLTLAERLGIFWGVPIAFTAVTQWLAGMWSIGSPGRVKFVAVLACFLIPYFTTAAMVIAGCMTMRQCF